ncbi:MAG TPA: TIGR03087 family PEP-CTERM/XrtA system glycosyltransferase [Rhizomicrobium sp.]|jgi:sugar transferase (PEP-CTERM/EpsH1 system associated)
MPRDILFLSHRLPYPPNKGDKIRSHALLRHLASQGTVHLGCFVDDPDDLMHLDTVREMTGGRCHFELIGPTTKAVRGAGALITGRAITVASFASSRLEKYLERVFQETRLDDVVVFGSAMAPYMFRPEFEPGRVLFDMVDVDSDKWHQYSNASKGFFKWLYKREAVMLEKTERSAARLFGRTLFVSEFEAETFRRIAPESADKTGALTNGVDLAYFAPGAFDTPFSAEECPIVMTGHMDYRPNYEGALWFAKEILPLVQKSVPNARVYFVGASPSPALRAAAGPAVTVTGRVADVRPYLQFAGAVVAPLRIARGVQNKVLEAMAMARPVIATREATRALGVRSGTHLLVANDPQHFADAVVSALKGGHEDIAQAGRAYVTQNHSWQTVLAGLDRELEKVRSAPHRIVAHQQGALRPAV